MEKKGLLTYIAIGLSSVLVAALMLMALGKLSIGFLNRQNDKYMQLYKDGEKGISSPWYQNGLHIVDEGFIDELLEMRGWDKNIVSIGSSLSVVSFQPGMVSLEDNYEYRFMVCGNGCEKSDEQLYGLYKAAEAEHDGDIVKLEMSFSTFRRVDTTIMDSTVSKWRRFKVNPDNTVTKTSPLLAPVCRLNLELLRMQNVWEICHDSLVQTIDNKRSGEERRVVPGNFRNNYFNYDAVAANCEMTDEMKESYLDLVDRIDSEHHLVVELSPIPLGLCETDYGIKLTGYIDDELIPALEERGISYLDYRYDYDDGEFCDGVHLGYVAGVRYTQKLTKDIDGIITDVR